MTLPRLSRLALLTTEAEVAALRDKRANALLDAVIDAPTAGQHQRAQCAAVAYFGPTDTAEAWTLYAAARDARIARRG